MPNKKKQHFVPKFLLKNFSVGEDRKSIGVWVLETNIYIPNASINHQACADYFYGKGLEVESAFETIENHVAPLFKRIILNNYLPERFSEEHVGLIGFVVSLSLRTETQADSVNEHADAIFKTAFRNDPRVKEELLKIKSSNAPAIALGSLDKCVIVSLDLDYKLLVNKTKHKFITSDNPVIKYNPFYGYRNTLRGHSGFASIGLQLFLCVDPNSCLLIFDRNIYRVGTKKQTTIELNDVKDVDSINALQYLNAYKTVYFNNEVPEIYIRNIADREKIHRRKLKPEIAEYYAVGNKPESEQSIMQLRQSIIKRDISLSFVRVLKKAKKTTDIHPEALAIRKPELVQFLTEDGATLPPWLNKIPKIYRSNNK
jgi:hypothetical protein